MFRARARGASVRRIAKARFLEIKTGCREQALRRARAYFEALQGRKSPLGRGFLDRLQWCAYRYVPGFLPELLLVTLLTGVLALWGTLGWYAAVLALGAGLTLTSLPVGRRFLRLLALIRAARQLEACEPLTAQWDMRREMERS